MKKMNVLLLLFGIFSGLLAEDSETLGLGEKAPDFSLKGIDGLSYSLESFKEAEVLTIVFSANHCPTAQAYEERMKKLSADYKSEEMMMLAWRSWVTPIWEILTRR
jgi:hypothetical protein